MFYVKTGANPHSAPELARTKVFPTPYAHAPVLGCCSAGDFDAAFHGFGRAALTRHFAPGADGWRADFPIVVLA